MEISSNSPQAIRSVIYVEDVVRALTAMLSAPPARTEDWVFNIGNPATTTVGTIARDISDANEQRGRAKLQTVNIDGSEKPMTIVPNIDRMREKYGWQPETTLKEGIKQMMDHRLDPIENCINYAV